MSEILGHNVCGLKKISSHEHGILSIFKNFAPETSFNNLLNLNPEIKLPGKLAEGTFIHRKFVNSKFALR